jgi:plasmid stabilization system protein ParE
MMPQSWSKKRERQYEHIKESAGKSGRSAARAKQIAAATVNKQREKSGETTNSGRRSGSRTGRRKTRSARKARARRKGGARR